MTAGCVTVLLAAACAPEPPPRTVADFLDNPRLLEATMVRCAENRSELKYTPECLNAREAVDRLAAREDAARREELEQQSARKRESLRRAQEAAAAARQRAEEEQRLREEAEFLGQFESIPREDGDLAGGAESSGGESGTVPPPQPGNQAASDGGALPNVQQQGSTPAVDAAPAAPQPAESGAGSDAPVQAAPEPPVSDLDAVREELRRRQQEESQPQN